MDTFKQSTSPADISATKVREISSVHPAHSKWKEGAATSEHHATEQRKQTPWEKKTIARWIHTLRQTERVKKGIHHKENIHHMSIITHVLYLGCASQKQPRDKTEQASVLKDPSRNSTSVTAVTFHGLTIEISKISTNVETFLFYFHPRRLKKLKCPFLFNPERRPMLTKLRHFGMHPTSFRAGVVFLASLLKRTRLNTRFCRPKVSGLAEEDTYSFIQ